MQATAHNGLTRGTVCSAAEGKLVLAVDNTNYELYLDCQAPLTAGQRVRGKVVVRARKVWTVSAGGSFITPLAGKPLVVQGIVKAVQGKMLIVQAGTPMCVELPEERSAFDMKNGEPASGVMVNVTTSGAARFELADG